MTREHTGQKVLSILQADSNGAVKYPERADKGCTSKSFYAILTDAAGSIKWERLSAEVDMFVGSEDKYWRLPSLQQRRTCSTDQGDYTDPLPVSLDAAKVRTTLSDLRTSNAKSAR